MASARGLSEIHRFDWLAAVLAWDVLERQTSVPGDHAFNNISVYSHFRTSHMTQAESTCTGEQQQPEAPDSKLGAKGHLCWDSLSVRPSGC